MTVQLVQLEQDANIAEWRREARRLIEARIAPNDVVWATSSSGSAIDLFARPTGPIAVTGQPSPRVAVPQAFLDLAEQVICHSAADRFALLYRLLWRLASNKAILHDPADPDVHRAAELAKDVRRDKHKMTAFVRFREVPTEGGSAWIAWFEPQHHIVEATAPFFVRRFTTMRWSILTPGISVHWDGSDLTFTTGASRADAPTEDALEAHWRVYFSAIFNPARLNVAAMQREMPKRYWKNMPEASLIPGLVRSATERTHEMLQNVPAHPGVTKPALRARMERGTNGSDIQGDLTSLAGLSVALNTCRRCPLWRHATHAVPGNGAAHAGMMFVGEQPGDQEDLRGEPFVGPAGKLLNSALEEAGIARSSLYVTNAVKHFKFEPRGKRRLHKKPNASEIDTCRWWLQHEIKLVAPKVIVALGATAATSLLQRPVKIGAERGKPLALPDGTAVWITVHPSYLLRLPDAEVAAVERRNFVADLRTAAAHARDLGVTL